MVYAVLSAERRLALVVLFLRALRGGCRYASLLALVLAACTAPESSGGESRTDAAVAVSTQALSEKPDDKCAVAVFQGHEYWFCSQNKSWSSARAQCQLEGLDLARIDSAAENAFIYSNLPIDAWIGASDQAAEGQWRWPDGVQFWSGGIGGSPMGGLYENWASGQPDNFFNQDCGAIETVFVAGEWADRACTELLDFVCERELDPGEPGVDCSTDNAPEGASWPSFRRCPSHQATAGLIGAQAAETFATYTTGGDVESSPAVGADGTIYFGSNDSYLYALNPDLTLAWRFDTAGAVRSSPAIGADGTIYVGSDDGRLYALNPNGTQKWSYLTLGAIWSSPAVSENGNVYVGSDNSRFYAFSPTGTKLWDIDTGAFVRSSAAISPDGTIYIGYEDWRLDAVNPDGSTKWSFGTLGPVTSSPAIGPDGTVYVGSFDGHLYAIHPGNGSEKWSFATSSPVTSSPAVAPDGSIVFGDDSGWVRALNPDGTLKWSYLTGDDVISSPAIGSDGVVYIGSYDNSVRALDPDDGSVLWTLATGADVFSSPAIGDNGVIYVGSDDDKLYAIGPGCSPSSPCESGEGPCGADADCASGLVCAQGIAERYGLPPHIGVCWDPVGCATLHPSDCGTPTSLCGDTCCVPDCGPGAGGDDGCGGVCQACVSGADSDGDGLPDCDERGDGDAWTDPLVHNGVFAQRGSTCHATPACGLIDTTAEIEACFVAVEDNRLSSGWDFATIDQNVCNPGFEFDLPWQGCGEDFAVKYAGAIKLEASGFHCFAVNGSQSSQCGALFFDGSTTALVSGAAASCYEAVAGVYPIEWFYETTSTGTNELHLDYCFSSTGACTPSQAIPPGFLRPAADADDRVCAADAPCSRLCPCGPGRAATHEDACEPLLELRTDVAERFGLAPGTSVCWDAEVCDPPWTSELFECGSIASLCGLCPACTPTCAGKSCGYDGCFGSCGLSCADGEAGCLSHDDCDDGLVCMPSSSGPNVCRPEHCSNPGLNPCSDPANAGQVTECGTCPACVPDCTGRACGPDPVCGQSCGEPGPDEFCTFEGTIEDKVLVLPIFEAGDPVPPVITVGDTPGTLEGHFAVSDFGQATYTIPLPVPPGRGGIEPRLALRYSSSAGDGYLGMGWGLTGLSAIQRCPKTLAQDGELAGIKYTDEDRFCLDGQRLVLEDAGATYGANGAKYRTEFDTFSRIVSEVEGTDDEPTRFKVSTRDGRIMTYEQRIAGNTPLDALGFRETDYSPDDVNAVQTQTWALSKVEDRLGNAMHIEYFIPAHCDSTMGAAACDSIMGGSAREYYPSAIHYTSHDTEAADRVVRFEYRPRRDALFGYQYGVRFERTQILERIVASAAGRSIFVYKFDYAEPDAPGGFVPPSELHDRTRLTAVQQCGRRGIAGDAEDAESCKPATVFEYEEVELGFEFAESNVSLPDVADADADFMGSSVTLDLDGNGQDDVLYPICGNPGQDVCTKLSWGLLLNGVQASNQIPNPERMVTSGSRGRVPASVFVMDYDMDGRDDLLEIDIEYHKGVDGEIARVWTYSTQSQQLNVEEASFVIPEPAYGAHPRGAYVLDADGDGRSDLLVCIPIGVQPVTVNQWFLYLHEGSGFGEPTRIREDGPPCFGGSAIDLNGDGAQELLLNTVSIDAWNLRNPVQAGSDVLWPSGELTRRVLPTTNSPRLTLDANGDGLTDLVEFSAELETRVYLNTGSGFVSQPTNDLELESGDYGGSEFLQQLRRFGTAMDENGDGRTDLLVRVRDDRWAVLRSLGTRFVVQPLPTEINVAGGNRLMVYDADHDGVKDIRALHGLWLRHGAPAHRLDVVTDGLGARIAVLYANLGQGLDGFDDELGLPIYGGGLTEENCDYPCYRKRPTGVVVRGIRYWDRPFVPDPDPDPPDNSTQAARSFVYGYRDGGSDLQGRGSLGFGARLMIDRERHARAEDVGGTHFSAVVYDNTYFDPVLRLYPYVGRVKSMVESTTAATGRHRAETVTRQFAYDATPRTVFPRVIDETRRVEESDGVTTELLSEVQITTDYDETYGNVTLRVETWGTGDQTFAGTVYMHETDVDYAEEHWLISLPSEQVSFSVRGGDDVTREQHFDYAEETGDPAFLHFTGLPTRVTQQPGDPVQERNTKYSYSEAGNVTAITVQGQTVDGLQARSTSFGYDDRQMFPILVTDSNDHEVQVKYDYALGVRIGTREEGREGEYVKRFSLTDGFGRIRQVYDPDGNFTDIDYLLRPVVDGGFSVLTTRAGAPEQVVHYDVLGREELREFDGLDQRLYVETRYNELGGVQGVSRPHNAAIHAELGDANKDFTTHEYDALGRLLWTTLPNMETVERCHLDNVVCTRNPRGYTRCDVYNEHGELAHSVDPLDIDPPATPSSCASMAAQVDQDFPSEGMPNPSSDYEASSYLYGPFGTVLSIIDPGNHAREFEYDDYGRVTTQEDPNAGTWHYTYNPFGEVQTEQDALLQRAVFRYDELGRRISRTDLDPGQPDTGTGALSLWIWDFFLGGGDGFYGQLFGTTSSDGVTTTMEYHPDGRLQTLEKTIPGDEGPQTLTRHQEYDGFGRLELVQYESAMAPPAEPLELRYEYHNGYLQKVIQPDGAGPGQDLHHWVAVTTNAYGQLNGEALNGLLWTRERVYEPDTGYLQRLTSTVVSGPELQDWEYDYDENGNLQFRTDHLPGGELTEYVYDELDRLEDALGVAYTESYEYNALGNITSKVVFDGTDTISRTYGYVDGTGRPHAVKSISQGAGPENNQQYQYDGNGNLVLRSGGLQPGFIASYNRQKMPATLSNATMTVSFAYDALGSRARKTIEAPEEATQETFYLDDAFSRSRVSGTSGFTERLVVKSGTEAVAEVVRDASGQDSLRYTLTDHLGSVELVVADPVTERRSYQAFGMRRAVTGSVPGGTRGDYTGHELDGEFGLINMKARLYDPEIGRFVSPDPILAEPGWSQGLNPYSYVNNRPMNFTDPTGETGVDAAAALAVACSTGVGCAVAAGAAVAITLGIVFRDDIGDFFSGLFGGGGDDGPPARGSATVVDASTETSTSIAPHASTPAESDASESPVNSTEGQPGVDPGVVCYASGCVFDTTNASPTNDLLTDVRLQPQFNHWNEDSAHDLLLAPYEVATSAMDAPAFLLYGGIKVVGKEGAEYLAREAAERGGREASRTAAAAERARNAARGVPESQLGPSGKPKIHVKEHATRKRAEDAAQARSRRGTAPEEHSNPTVGDPHFHPTGPRHREHHTYPRRGHPRNEEY